MQAMMTGYGGMYEAIRKNLTNDEIGKAIARITVSERFEMDKYYHIILAGTKTVVGYVGNTSLELYCSEENNPKVFRIPHKHLKRIFNSV